MEFARVPSLLSPIPEAKRRRVERIVERHLDMDETDSSDEYSFIDDVAVPDWRADPETQAAAPATPAAAAPAAPRRIGVVAETRTPGHIAGGRLRLQCRETLCGFQCVASANFANVKEAAALDVAKWFLHHVPLWKVTKCEDCKHNRRLRLRGTRVSARCNCKTRRWNDFNITFRANELLGLFVWLASKSSARDFRREFVLGRFKFGNMMDLLCKIGAFTGDHFDEVFAGVPCEVMEADETAIAGKRKYNRGARKRTDSTQWVAGHVHHTEEHTAGQLCARHVVNRTRATLLPPIARHATQDTTVVTDEWAGYNGLANFAKHQRVNHSRAFVNTEGWHTNTIEGQWKILKRERSRLFPKFPSKHKDADAAVQLCVLMVNAKSTFPQRIAHVLAAFKAWAINEA